MSLIKLRGMLPVYKEASGFKYPWAMEYWEAHDNMIWHKGEYSLSKDISDYAAANLVEKDFLTKVMNLFVQNDVKFSVLVAKSISKRH